MPSSAPVSNLSSSRLHAYDIAEANLSAIDTQAAADVIERICPAVNQRINLDAAPALHVSALWGAQLLDHRRRG